ncbi:MAG: iron ABC transporter permease [Alphaproteobacteria bacterium]
MVALENGRSAGGIVPGVTALGGAIALLVGAPLAWLAVEAIGARSADIFGAGHLLTYLLNSLVLGGGVALLAGIIGTITAALVSLTEFPGRGLLERALVLPLAAPAYILAYAYSQFLQHSGPVQTLLRAATGWGPRDYWFPDIRSLPGAILIFALVLYPYVYLLLRAAFLEQSPALFDAARSLGRRPLQAFLAVSLPLARPALVAGLALAVMETLADFGVVSHFGIQTFTTAIYEAYAFLGDRPLAAALALTLLGIVGLLLVLERADRGRAATRTTAPARERARIALKGVPAVAAFATCALPVLLGAALPAAILFGLAIPYGHDLLSTRYAALLSNTLLLGILGAAVVVTIGLVLAYAGRAARGPLARVALGVSVVGYAIPGSVIAIAVLAPLAALDNLANLWAGELFGARLGLFLTGSIVALVYAYAVRFAMIGTRASAASLQRITPAIDQAARTLGRSELGVLRDIHAPMLRGSLMASALIVFVEIVKELPATLILRPFNFDTLAIQVYRLAADERLAEASSGALAILGLGLVSVFFLMRTISRR